MSMEQLLPDVMPLPLADGLRPCFHGTSIQILRGRAEGECTCGKCPPLPPPHVVIIITHEVAAPYFIAMGKAAGLKFARELIEELESLPGPAVEPEVEARQGRRP